MKIALAIAFAALTLSSAALADPPAHPKGLGPVRTIAPIDARQAIRAEIATKFGVQKGLQIRLKSAGPAADRFTALGAKGPMGLRFSAGGMVVQGPGQSKAKVTQIYQNKM
jgi:hypothetical protein